MHDNQSISLGRVDRFFQEWVVPAIEVAESPLTVEGWEVPGEPVDFAEAMSGDFFPKRMGESWSRPWGTTWFRIGGSIPEGWPLQGTRCEIDVDLGFQSAGPGFQAEGAAWSVDGRLLKGVSPRNRFIPAEKVEVEPGRVEFYVEAASNPDVPDNDQWTKPTVMGDVRTSGPTPIYALRRISVVLVSVEVEELVADVRTLRGIVDTLPEGSARRSQIIEGLEGMCDVFDPEDIVNTANVARRVLEPLFEHPAPRSEHEVHAIGHAHIDSAWLWPVRETERKVGRTVANILELMDTNPELTYAFSSAQQYAWIKEKYPELYSRMAERIAEGRIIPVGGMWVESDANMIGAESLVRQFLLGTRFFQEEFSVTPKSVWLPDSFGYTGAFPQIAHLVGMDDFLTQKLSWNDTNRMPHSTFWWEGIDGTRVFTHFPPVDDYASDLSSADLKRASDNYTEKRWDGVSMVPFGYGDGGGGPTREMIAQGRRARDLEGIPRVLFSTPNEFFETARERTCDVAPVWYGELYLEYHRGTYTSQHRTKAGNRLCENLLREAETWATYAAVRCGVPYPYEDLRAAWETVLLQQFHDILPGSSIAWVHREAEEKHREVAADLELLIASSIRKVLGGSDDSGRRLTLNAAPVVQNGIDPMGVGVAGLSDPARAYKRDGLLLMENDAVRVTVNELGLIVSIVDVVTNREVVPAGQHANMLQLFRDIPNKWEAWDIEKHYKRNQVDITECDSILLGERPDGVPYIEVSRSFSKSTATQTIWLGSGDDSSIHLETKVDWHEQQKLLKLSFPVTVHADAAYSETQFGQIRRSAHENTSWDSAQFETVALKWIRVEEPGFGVSLSNNTTYGHDITRERFGEESGSLLRASLLRAPLFPDPGADQGEHVFRHELTIGADAHRAYESGYRINLPLREVIVNDDADASLLRPLVRAVDDEDGKSPFYVESVKLAEDKSGDVIVRLFEPLGAHAQGRLLVDFPYESAEAVNLLEDPFVDSFGAVAIEREQENILRLSLKPFQIGTIRFSRR